MLNVEVCHPERSEGWFGFCVGNGMDKRSAAIGFLRFAGRFYKWAFRNIFRLVKKSDEHIKAIEEKKAGRMTNIEQ
jgi:hypothetical protein